MLWVKQPCHCRIVASKRMWVTIVCPLSHAHIQVKSVIKIVNTPFFTRILNVSQTTHAIVKKNKLKSIDLVSYNWLTMHIINKEHNKKMKSGNMSKETNIEEFFTLPESLQKNDVNRHTKNSEYSKKNFVKMQAFECNQRIDGIICKQF